MASPSGAKSRRSASGGYDCSSPSAFASSSSTFSSGRPSTFMSRSPSSNRVAMYGKSSSSLSSSAAAASVRFQIDRRSSTSPARSISVQKTSDNANAVSSNKKKVCTCSPTTHPGSFRCSLHKNSNRRQFQNGSSSTLNFRRSAMTNSLVRIGGVEGGDLVRRALSALIRPSSHQQRRQLAFQPRPSRLSVMSRAEED